MPGVTISSKRFSKKHINYVVNKAREKRFALWRTLKFVDWETKKVKCRTPIRLILEYANTVSHSKCNKKNERVQTLAGRLIHI